MVLLVSAIMIPVNRVADLLLALLLAEVRSDLQALLYHVQSLLSKFLLSLDASLFLPIKL